MKLTAAARLPWRRRRTAVDNIDLTPSQARSVERECLEVLAKLRPRAPFEKAAFLQHLAYVAGGPIYTAELPKAWAELLASHHGGHTSAITLSQYDGWVIWTNPRAGVPDVLNFGHEAGHILFDAPRGTGSPPNGNRLELPEADSLEAEQLLAHSWARRGGFKGLPESRAERFGSMLKATLEGLGSRPDAQVPDNELSSLFRAGDV